MRSPTLPQYAQTVRGMTRYLQRKQCRARSIRTGNRCLRPAALGSSVCRTHGARTPGPRLSAFLLKKHRPLTHFRADADGLHQIDSVPPGAECVPLHALDGLIRLDWRLDDGHALYATADTSDPLHLRAVLHLDRCHRIRWTDL